MNGIGLSLMKERSSEYWLVKIMNSWYIVLFRRKCTNIIIQAFILLLRMYHMMAHESWYIFVELLFVLPYSGYYIM
jgi:hypothetical protein